MRRRYKIYRVVQPCVPGYEGMWCVYTRPSFYYYGTRQEARDAVRRMRGL